jgi:hypothetical protein
MSQTPRPDGADSAVGRVEIRVKGQLDARWNVWFDQLTIASQDDGTTSIHGPVVDQAALFGVLHRLLDLALPLISVVYVDPEPRPASAASSTTDPSTPERQPRSTS